MRINASFKRYFVMLIVLSLMTSIAVAQGAGTAAQRDVMTHEEKVASYIKDTVEMLKQKMEEIFSKIDVYLYAVAEKYEKIRPEISSLRQQAVNKIERIRAELGTSAEKNNKQP
ncbi:MAG: hypothetical protein ABIG55_05420 [Candidatus Omnitrophota bacterium]|nr:hypothetical protein [Candidatus Omnitrophota bacterium]